MADKIYKKVMEALQDAEDMGGPEGKDYIALMNRIIDECKKRISNCKEHMDEGMKKYVDRL